MTQTSVNINDSIILENNFNDRNVFILFSGAKMDPINKTEVIVINEIANEKDNSDKDEFETLMQSKL